MNILLLNPFGRELSSATNKLASKYFEEPLGLMYIYSYLKKYAPGHQLVLCDASLLLEENECETMESLWEELRRRIEDFTPGLVGISALYYSNAEIVDKTARMIKNIDPNIVVVIGGSYATHLPHLALKSKHIDYCVFSEGEDVFCRLINAIETGTSLDEIDGIAYGNGNGKIIINHKKTFIENLDSIPFPDREAVPFEKYLRGGRRALYRYYKPEDLRIASITSTRGCPYQCAFCGSKTFWGRRIRFRTPEKVIEEMIEMQDKYAVNTFVFNDDNQCVNTKHFMKLLDLIIEHLPEIKWISGGGLNVRAINNPAIIQKMCDSGICLFNLAIESGKNETLQRIHKPVTIEESENVVRLIRKCCDLPINGFFIIGFPFETIGDMQVTINFAKQLNLDWSTLANLQPHPGSELYQYCLDKGLIDGFNINYGENYLPSNIHYDGFTSVDVSRMNYDANIDINFINNFNLRRNPQRVIGDFNYVLSLVPEHYIATYCKGIAYRNLGDKENAKECFRLTKKHLAQDSLYYKYFLKYDLLRNLEQGKS